jgi:enterochelin esterase-like enzyme
MSLNFWSAWYIQRVAVLAGVLVGMLAASGHAQWTTVQVNAPRVQYRTMQSAAAGTAVSFHVYTPPVYDSQPERRFPVLYWLHGSGSATAGIAPMTNWFSTAMAQGLLPPMVIVFPNGMPNGMYCNAADGTTPLETVIISELIPHVDANFRTIAARGGRILEGFSMGGYGTGRFGAKYSELFCAISILAPGPMQLDFPNAPVNVPSTPESRAAIFEDVWNSDTSLMIASNPSSLASEFAPTIISNNLLIRIAVGADDAVLPPVIDFHDHLTSLGIPHTFNIFPGIGHQTIALLTAMGPANWEFYREALGPCDPDAGVWSALGSGTDGSVFAIVNLPGGDVIVGGEFTTAGGVAANNIARYNVSTGVWSALGSGTIGAVQALAVLPDGNIIVGGSFAIGGGVSVGRIARVDTATGLWYALSGGTNGIVQALAVLPNGDVVAGGQFTSAGGVAASRIAKVNPNTGVWTALGSGTNSISRAFAVLPGGDLLVGGLFTSAGGVAANRVARVNINTGVWSAVGSGTSGAVLTLAVLPDGDVVAGGSFTSAGGMAANRIARVNVSTGVWSALGSGVNSTVNSVAVLPDGKILVGGMFTIAAGEAVNRIARYDPAIPGDGGWSSLAEGADGTVNTIVSGSEVLVGGAFLNVGGVAAGGIARYTLNGGAPIITSQPQAAAACPSGAVTFSVTAGGRGPFTYQWRRDSVNIDILENPSARIVTLTLANVSPDDLGAYDCIISNQCGSVTSNTALLTICIADYNCDGGVDGGDVEAFFVDWSDADVTADVNYDGGIDGGDVEVFFERWVGGC